MKYPQAYQPVLVLTGLPSSKECRVAGDPVSPMDLAKDAFDPDGGNDDPGPCLPKKTHCILVTILTKVHFVL